MSKRNRRKVKRNPHQLKRFTSKSLNTGPSPMWRTLLYHTPGQEVRSMCRETTDYRKVNPVWTNPSWDASRKSHHKYKLPKEELKKRLHRLVVEDNRRIIIELCTQDTRYWFEKVNKITEALATSMFFSSLQEARFAYDNGHILWLKGEVNDNSSIHLPTPGDSITMA